MVDHNALSSDYLPMEEFFSKLQCWKGKFGHEKDRAIESGLDKLRKRANSSHKTTSNASEIPREVISASNVTRTFAKDKTKINLKKAKKKEEDKNRALAMTIDKAKANKEFDCLNKMAEACDMGRAQGVSFIA